MRIQLYALVAMSLECILFCYVFICSWIFS